MSNENRLFAFISACLTLVYENANLQIVNKIISRKSRSLFLNELLARATRSAAPKAWSVGVSAWCLKIASMKYLWHMIITRNLEHTHKSRRPQRNLIHYSFPLQLLSGSVLSDGDRALLSSKNFLVLLPIWQVFFFLLFLLFAELQIRPKRPKSKKKKIGNTWKGLRSIKKQERRSRMSHRMDFFPSFSLRSNGLSQTEEKNTKAIPSAKSLCSRVELHRATLVRQ